MADFAQAVNYVLSWEGGFSENPADPGGCTNFGISLRFLREIPLERLHKYGIFEPIDEQTIRNLTIDQAKLIYRGEFWDKELFDQIHSQTIANYYFDTAINLGMAPATRLVQRALCFANMDPKFVADDGIFGLVTLDKLNQQTWHFIKILVAVRASWYRALVRQNINLAPFLIGWINRAFGHGNN